MSFAPPTKPARWSNNVTVNGRGVVRSGDPIEPHICEPDGSPHTGTYEGSKTVSANGSGIVRIGDPVSCGDTAATGSSNVTVGG